MGNEVERYEELPLLMNMRDFHYDPSRRIFVVGDDDGSMNFDLQNTEDSFNLVNDTFDIAKDVQDLDGRLLGIDTFGYVIEYPEMRKWIAGMEDIERRELGVEVANEIRLAWNAINPDHTFSEEENVGGFTRFHASILDDGTFILNTFGNCACLGRTPVLMCGYMGRFDENDLDTCVGCALHNADTPSQRLSLYAGAGSLAWMMKNE